MPVYIDDDDALSNWLIPNNFYFSWTVNEFEPNGQKKNEKKERTHTARDRQRKRVFKLLASNQVKNSVGTRHAFKILYTFCFYHFPIKKNMCIYHITWFDNSGRATIQFQFGRRAIEPNAFYALIRFLAATVSLQTVNLWTEILIQP